MSKDPNQQWGFSPTGQIYSLAKPSLFLTYVAQHQVTVLTSDQTASTEAQPPQDSKPEQQEKEMDSSFASLQFVDMDEVSGGLGEEKPNKAETASKQEAEQAPGLADLKADYGGQSHDIVLLPKLAGKNQNTGSQRLILYLTIHTMIIIYKFCEIVILGCNIYFKRELT